MQRRRRGQNSQPLQTTPSTPSTRPRRQRQVVILSSSSSTVDEINQIPEIKVNKTNKNENDLIDSPINSSDSNSYSSISQDATIPQDWRHKGNEKSPESNSLKQNKSDIIPNKYNKKEIINDKSNDDNKGIINKNINKDDSNKIKNDSPKINENDDDDQDSSSDIYHLSNEYEQTTPKKRIKRRRVKKIILPDEQNADENESHKEKQNDPIKQNINDIKTINKNENEQQNKELPKTQQNDIIITKSPKNETKKQELQEGEILCDIEAKAPSSKSSPISKEKKGKNKSKIKKRDKTHHKHDLPDEIPDIYSDDPNVIEYTIKREKRMLGMKKPTFYLMNGDEMIYHSKLMDVDTKKAYVINTDENVDRFSHSFVGYLLKHEMNTRFTLKMPLNKIDESTEKEVLGFYFYHHEDKTRHAYLVEAPSNQPYFPGTKELSLSRLAKSMTVPEYFTGYTGCSTSAKLNSMESIKNMELFEMGKESPIVSILKIEKDTYKLRMYKKYPTIFGFSFALGSIVTKPSLLSK